MKEKPKSIGKCKKRKNNNNVSLYLFILFSNMMLFTEEHPCIKSKMGRGCKTLKCEEKKNIK